MFDKLFHLTINRRKTAFLFFFSKVQLPIVNIFSSKILFLWKVIFPWVFLVVAFETLEIIYFRLFVFSLCKPAAYKLWLCWLFNKWWMKTKLRNGRRRLGSHRFTASISHFSKLLNCAYSRTGFSKRCFWKD